MSNTELCRTCLQEGLNFINIFSKQEAFNETNNAVMLVSEMLSTSISIEVHRNDDLPKNICQECLSKLLITYNFRLLCENSYRWLLENKYSLCTSNIGDDNFQSDFIKEECTKSDELNENHNFNNDNDSFEFAQLDCEYSLKRESTEVKSGLIKPESIEINKTTKPNQVQKNLKSSSRKRTEKIIKCNLCPKMFAYHFMMRNHLKSHNSKNYYCSKCKKYYKSQVLHEKVHKLGKKFICDICSKKFSSKCRIQIHIETHSSNRERPFKCKVSECNKAYFTIQNLERHELCHSGTKDFMCHLCSKAFTDKYGLECHLLLHTREKKHSCRICNEKFLTRAKRYNHEVRHDDKKFTCKYCLNKFYTNHMLKKHMVTHTNEKRYKCKFCTSSFSRSDNKKRHELTVHDLMESLAPHKSEIMRKSD